MNLLIVEGLGLGSQLIVWYRLTVVPIQERGEQFLKLFLFAFVEQPHNVASVGQVHPETDIYQLPPDNVVQNF